VTEQLFDMFTRP